VLVQERGKTAHVFVADRIAFVAQLSRGRFHIQGIPEDDHVQREAHYSKLIFVAFAVVLSQLAAFAGEDGPSDTMVYLTPIEQVQDGSGAARLRGPL